MSLLKELLESTGVTLVANKGSKDAANFTVKVNGKSVGTIWQTEEDGSWEAEYTPTGASWECDSKQDAIDMIKDQLNESVVTESVLESDKARMIKMLDTLEQNIERVSVQLMPNSQLAKQLAKVGGDMKHFASLVKMFNTVHDEVLDLVMYTNTVMVDE